jgi:tRNA-uridine 2-sulfurtransferase
MSAGLDALTPHWISGRQPHPIPLSCQARLRHRQPPQDCELIAVDRDGCRVRFKEPQRAVTPGQSIVFYRDTECLGGGVIERGWNDLAPA